MCEAPVGGGRQPWKHSPLENTGPVQLGREGKEDKELPDGAKGREGMRPCKAWKPRC